MVKKKGNGDNDAAIKACRIGKLESIALKVLDIRQVEKIKPNSQNLADIGKFLDGLILQFVSHLALPDFFPEAVTQVIYDGYLPEMKEKASRHVKRSEIALESMHELLFLTKGYFSLASSFCCRVILTCATYSLSDSLWSSKRCAKASANILDTLLTYRDESTLPDLVSTLSKALLTSVRKLIQKGEDGNRWKKHPGSSAILFFLVHKLPPQSINNETLPLLMPMVFTITDDFEPSHRAFGLPLLFKIVHSIPTTDLDPYLPIILKIFRTSFNYDDIPVVQSLLSSIFDALSKLLPKKRRQNHHNPIVMDKYSELIKAYLTKVHRYVQGPDDKEILEIYSKSLVPFLKFQGLEACAKLSSILKSTLMMAHIDRKSIMKITLEVIREIAIQCWPRVSKHLGKLIMSVFHIFLTARKFESNFREEIEGEVEWTLIIFKEIDANAVYEYCKVLQQMPELKDLVSKHLKQNESAV